MINTTGMIGEQDGMHTAHVEFIVPLRIVESMAVSPSPTMDVSIEASRGVALAETSWEHYFYVRTLKRVPVQIVTAEVEKRIGEE